MNILLLEDDFTLSTEIRTFLETHGFECDCVYDGSLFTRQFKAKEYGLVDEVLLTNPRKQKKD